MDCHSSLQGFPVVASPASEYVIPPDAYRQLSATCDQLGALERFVSDPHLKDFLASFHRAMDNVLGQVSERPAALTASVNDGR